MDNKNIGSRIKEARKYLNYKQVDFAERIGMASGSLSDAENGKRFPPFEAFVSICGEFDSNGLSIEWLLTGKGNMIKPITSKYQDLTIRETDLLHIFRSIDEYVQPKLIGIAMLLSEIQIETKDTNNHNRH